MKRFHVHLHVDDLAKSVAFYAKLFAAEPTRTEADYAKWMLEDPPVNFAISTRGNQPGIDHLGIQTDDPAELAVMKSRAEAAELALLDQGEISCCYARSEKHWVTDPQGIAWEHFHTLGNIPMFNDSGSAMPTHAMPTGVTPTDAAACCAPSPQGRPIAIPVKSAGGCC